MERRDQSQREQREGGEMVLWNYVKQQGKIRVAINLVTDFFCEA